MKNFFTILLVVMALTLVVSVFAGFSKRGNDLDTDVPGVNDDVETPGNTEQPDNNESSDVEKMGYEIRFKESFFNDLANTDLSLYVDGEQVTKAPEGNVMHGFFVELKSSGVGNYYNLSIDDTTGLTIYKGQNTGGQWADWFSYTEFSTPVILRLGGPVTFETIIIK